jgi:hypothetical protein
LSIGLGRGLTSQLEGVKALVTQPREVLEGMAQFAGEVIDDPRVLAEMAKEYGIKATSSPMGFGEVVGEMLSPIRGGKVPKAEIVKPVGNLNLAPAIRAEALKGPEKQTPQSFLNQAQKLPGVTKEGFEEATKSLQQMVKRYEDQPVTISKSSFESTVPPSLYSKVDLAGGSESAWEHYLDMASEMVNNDPDSLDTEILYRLGLPVDNPVDRDNLINFTSGEEVTDPRFLQALERRSIRSPDDLAEIQNEVIESFARQIREDDWGGEIGGQGRYSYGQYQRLMATPEMDDPGYFEIGVTHPSMEGIKYRHFGASNEPLIGHIRGTYLSPDRPPEAYEVVHDWSDGTGKRGVMDIFEAKPNSVLIEELQSDAQKGDFEQTGALRQVHGTLFKAAVQDALERGADTVYMPTAVPIAAVRGKMPKDYASIYDQQVVKEGLNPLKKIPGVTVTPIESKGKTTYYEINFSPEAKEYILKGPGQLAPGYADGGAVDTTDYTQYNDRILKALVAKYKSEAKAREMMRKLDGGELLRIMREYEEAEIERIVAPLRAKLEGYLGEAKKLPRKAKQAVADVTEIGDIIKRSKEIPLTYYDPKGEVAGEADAMRHLLFQAQLQQKYGELPAKAVSYIHEYSSFGQPSAEREMDFLNDELGREIGRSAKSDRELVEMARRYIESGRAKTLPKEQRGGY